MLQLLSSKLVCQSLLPAVHTTAVLTSMSMVGTRPAHVPNPQPKLNLFLSMCVVSDCMLATEAVIGVQLPRQLHLDHLPQPVQMPRQWPPVPQALSLLQVSSLPCAPLAPLPSPIAPHLLVSTINNTFCSSDASLAMTTLP